MTPSADNLAKLRRMVAEPTNANYTDAILTGYLELYPIVDVDGLEPDNAAWTATYDFHSAAADIWEEKAATVAAQYDFNADGGSYNRNQVYSSFVALAQWHRKRSNATAASVVNRPTEYTESDDEWYESEFDYSDLS